MPEIVATPTSQMLLHSPSDLAIALPFPTDTKVLLEGETMPRRLGSVFVAALLIAAAGCTAGSFLLSWAGTNDKQQIVSGSMDDVAAHLRASLGKLNIVVAVNPMDDGTIKLSGKTKAGRRFDLLLQRHKTSRGESTAVTVEWEKEADEQFWASVLELLVAPTPFANGVPTSADGINSGR